MFCLEKTAVTHSGNETIRCNDLSESRINRVTRVMKQFLYSYDKMVSKGEISFSVQDGRFIDEQGTYDKILVDVPCTTDRHSVNEEDNNIFKPSRVKERLQLPQLQSELLVNALKLVEPGGTVVYSTCTLSPLQNDGVIQASLQRIWEETDHEITIVDLKEAVKSLSLIFKFHLKPDLRYGNLVLPYTPANFGPMYFCKLKKIK